MNQESKPIEILPSCTCTVVPQSWQRKSSWEVVRYSLMHWLPLSGPCSELIKCLSLNAREQGNDEQKACLVSTIVYAMAGC